MKKHFDKKLVITKVDNKDLEKSTKCWIVIMFMLMVVLK